jgi:hypothetical protein
MSSQLKYVVEELKVLFPKKNYNLIEFDAFQADQLIQVGIKMSGFDRAIFIQGSS